VGVVTDEGAGTGYRGERLGLPAEGRGSLVGFGRRFVALLVDWAAANLVTLLLAHGRLAYGTPKFSEIVLAVFAVEVWLLTWLTAASFGQRFLGIVVVGLDGNRLGPGRAAVRTLLICLVVPPLLWDGDARGLHDRAVGSVVVLGR
jgi:uncharacterized RDD family membrane protein YckC